MRYLYPVFALAVGIFLLFQPYAVPNEQTVSNALYIYDMALEFWDGRAGRNPINLLVMAFVFWAWCAMPVALLRQWNWRWALLFGLGALAGFIATLFGMWHQIQGWALAGGTARHTTLWAYIFWTYEALGVLLFLRVRR